MFHATNSLTACERIGVLDSPTGCWTFSESSNSSAGCAASADSATRCGSFESANCCTTCAIIVSLDANHPRIPTGFRPPAQGCEERATLGIPSADIPNPEGVASSSQSAEHHLGTPFVCPRSAHRKWRCHLPTRRVHCSSPYTAKSLLATSGTRHPFSRTTCHFKAMHARQSDWASSVCRAEKSSVGIEFNNGNGTGVSPVCSCLLAEYLALDLQRYSSNKRTRYIYSLSSGRGPG